MAADEQDPVIGGTVQDRLEAEQLEMEKRAAWLGSRSLATRAMLFLVARGLAPEIWGISPCADGLPATQKA